VPSAGVVVPSTAAAGVVVASDCVVPSAAAAGVVVPSTAAAGVVVAPDVVVPSAAAAGVVDCVPSAASAGVVVVPCTAGAGVVVPGAVVELKAASPHAATDTAPATVEYLPSGHSEQASDPFTSLKVPVAHAVHVSPSAPV
jgi:hypothetical protein